MPTAQANRHFGVELVDQIAVQLDDSPILLGAEQPPLLGVLALQLPGPQQQALVQQST